MSVAQTRAAPASTERAATALGAGIVLAGSAALAVRPLVTADGRLVLFVGLYLALAMASLAATVPTDRARLSPAVVLVFGLGAVATAAMVAGRPVPVPWSVWALPVSALAAVAEEALFRRVGYAWLARLGAPVAIVGMAALFALVHLPAYGVAAVPVDLGAGLLFGWQRWASGNWLVPAATHVAANALVVLG